MHKRLAIYRAALHLYPKRYRQQYGEQMVQTVADMLDDKHGTAEKGMVWLRIYCELPLSIIRENISVIGDSTMHKLSLMSNKRLVFGLAAILLVVMFFTVPAWLRFTVIPRVVGISSLPKISSEIQAQQKAIGEPFQKFYSYVPEEQKKCNLTYASKFTTDILCSSAMNAYVVLPQDEAGKQDTLENARAIQDRLKEQGYDASYNGVTLVSLVEGTYQGKDYTPDASYFNNKGAYDCGFSVTVAYANPKPPAINMRMWCDGSTSFFSPS